MAWSSDAHFRAIGKAPDCYACAYYQSRLDRSWSEHCCSIAKPAFPNGGRYCPYYEYESGSDKAEYPA